VCQFVRFAARTGAPRVHGFSKTNEARRSSFVLRPSSFVGRQSSVVSRQSSVVSRQSSVVVEIRRRSPLPRTARSHTRQRDELASSVIVEH
jgi:hypothetical protein